MIGDGRAPRRRGPTDTTLTVRDRIYSVVATEPDGDRFRVHLVGQRGESATVWMATDPLA